MSENITKFELDIVIKSCIDIGLSNDSALLYKILIQNPDEKSITNISINTSLSRQKVYSCLEELFEFKLIEKNATDKFTVNSPTILLAKLRQKNLNSEINEKKLRENLIWLNTPFSKQNTKMIDFLTRENELITFFINQYEDATKEILFFGSTSQFIKLIGSEIINLVTKIRVEKSIPHRIITTDINISNIIEHTETRFVKYIKNFDCNNCSYSIFDNCVIYWNMSLSNCTIIYDKNTIELLRNQFEYFWFNQ